MTLGRVKVQPERHQSCCPREISNFLIYDEGLLSNNDGSICRNEIDQIWNRHFGIISPNTPKFAENDSEAVLFSPGNANMTGKKRGAYQV
jgi:hypothetical protein